MDGFKRDLARDAGQFEIDAVDHADRARGDEIARNDADRRVRHRRVGQALAESGLDVEAQFAGGFLGAFERGGIRDTQAVVIARLDIAQRQLLLDLGPRAVHHDDLDAHGMQKR